MRLLCIDPGTTVSGAVVIDTESMVVIEVYPEAENEWLRGVAGDRFNELSAMAIEKVASYGMPVGREVFETVLWTGRFMEAFGINDCTKIYRKDVKMELCQSMRAKDANVRQAILDRYPATGGGKTPQIGTKKQPGPLYGVSKHAWSALAVGLTWAAQNE